MLKFGIVACASASLLFPFSAFAQSPDVDSIIESYITQGEYVSSTSPCSGRALSVSGQSLSQYARKKTNGIASQVNRGDSYTMVGGKITQTLNAVSYCYNEEGRPVSDRGNIASDMARLLVYRLQGKSDFDTNATDFANARALTQFAKARGTDMSFEEQALKQFDSPKPTVIAGIVDTEVDFNKIAEEFKSNSLRVKKRYANKQVVGSGKIYAVQFIPASPTRTSSEDRLIVKFDGPKTYSNGGTSGDLETATFIQCHIEMGTLSEDKAIELDKGDSVKVSGLFEMDKFGRLPPSIQNCVIH